MLAAAAAAGPAVAATPERPLRWIVGYPPGGSTDMIARLLGQFMGPRLGQTIVVENRPGAGSALGAEQLAKSAPDGLTVGSADNGTLIINPVIYPRLAYDPDRDFRPVGLFARLNLLLAVKADSPIRSAADYLERARRGPSQINYASPGIGSPLHLAMERLQREAGVTLNHIPYRGMAPALNDVLASAVSSVVVDFTTGSEMVRSGMLRPLAVLSADRLAALPEVPTMAESGLPNFSAFAWQGLIAPRGTADAVIDRLSTQLTAALAEPAVRSRYESLGLEIPQSDPRSFAEQWQADKAFWQPLIRDLGIRMEG